MGDPPKDPFQRFYRLLLTLLGLGFLYLIWPYISNVILLVVFAFLFTTVLLPIVDWLEGRMKNRGLAVMSTVFTILAVIVLFLSSFVVQLSQEARAIAKDLDQEQLVEGLHELRTAVVGKLPNFAQEYLRGGSGAGADEISRYVNTVIQKLSQLTGVIGSFLFFAARSSRGSGGTATQILTFSGASPYRRRPCEKTRPLVSRP